MDFFNIESVFFEIWGYPMSYLEFFGTVAGGVAVWLAARANIWSWPIGLINVTLFFFLFFQVQLYPDMFLQAFFFVTNLMGWWRWAHPNPEEEDRKKELRISFMPLRQLLVFSSIGAVGTVLMGAFASNLHEWFPIVFGRASAFPYLDSFVTVMSIVATYLMIQKKVECWVVWIVVDIVATGLYFAKGIKFVGIEYLAFCFLAAFGLWKWMKEYKSYTASG
ncbi:MAG TPA: nicotinamide riboside transporter PnuC [Cyclobacteriaceae bacterium]|nr:nicotinamide riboside transporter PnuC [Cyclobacteriaceae bacterium]MCB9237341.1 nicotinamide mononucleotide transporter [Flammeovirgaceae bacterium]MCB0500276.1 nicotinamide mononucleotide transporter [Cyclobacteriaceae bacterium]MCO5271051.1 nicotinamide riboside transporter PnuC [Cyclobacteriaceae bacterium]MCW5903428.1 nicotinamide riboside transporter PnuC [Cyclobacteriaceae bacterium]